MTTPVTPLDLRAPMAAACRKLANSGVTSSSQALWAMVRGYIEDATKAKIYLDGDLFIVGSTVSPALIATVPSNTACVIVVVNKDGTIGPLRFTYASQCYDRIKAAADAIHS